MSDRVQLVPRGWLPDPEASASFPPLSVYLSRADWELAGKPESIEEYQQWLQRQVRDGRIVP